MRSLAIARKLVRRALLPNPKSLRPAIEAVRGKRGLEIGGPSEIFSHLGWLPVYRRARVIDNLVFSRSTVWAEQDGRYPVAGEVGACFISDAVELQPIPDSSYDFVLSCHVLEHIANPLLALKNWKRVLKPGGALLLLVPDRGRMFDHDRPLTTVDHLLWDYSAGTPESDLGHLPEILALHDYAMDPLAGSPQDFQARAARNIENRCLHHHTFSPETVSEALTIAGFDLEVVETLRPWHIVALARTR